MEVQLSQHDENNLNTSTALFFGFIHFAVGFMIFISITFIIAERITLNTLIESALLSGLLACVGFFIIVSYGIVEKHFLRK